MEFLFVWLLGEGRGEGQSGDWNECHSASVPCLYGTVTARRSTLLARSVLPSIFMEAENRCGEGKEQWLVWCFVQRLVPRLILLSLHPRHAFPVRDQIVLSPKCCAPNVHTSTVDYTCPEGSLNLSKFVDVKEHWIPASLMPLGTFHPMSPGQGLSGTFYFPPLCPED